MTSLTPVERAAKALGDLWTDEAGYGDREDMALAVFKSIDVDDLTEIMQGWVRYGIPEIVIALAIREYFVGGSRP